MRTVLIMKRLFVPFLLTAVGLPGLVSCSSTSPSADVVVTTTVMADIVRMVVPGDVTVTSVIPDGKDPHEYQPAPRDIALVSNARVVVGSGFGFDGGLEKALASARAAGATVFVPERDMRSGWQSELPSQTDPHWFLHVPTVRRVVDRLAEVIGDALGRDLSAERDDADAALDRLSGEIAGRVGSIPSGACMIGEEHNMLSALLGEYGCGGAVLTTGSLVPSAEPAAYELERFIKTMKDRNIKVIVRDPVEPSRLLHQAADATGAALVDVNVHGTGGARSYPDFVIAIIAPIVEALS